MQLKLIPLFIFIIFCNTITVEGLIPVTYSCCKNFTSDNGRSLYSDIESWRYQSKNSYIEADNLNYKIGNQGVKLVSIDGEKLYVTKDINENFFDTKNFVLDLYVYDDNEKQLILNITSDKNWSKYFYYSFDLNSKGWNRYVIPKKDFRNKRGDDWNNTMIMLRFSLIPTNGNSSKITIGDIRYDLLGKPKIILNFDDGTIGDLAAESILTANNQSATSFIIVDQVVKSKAGYMTIDDIKKLQYIGWDISSHTMSHPHLTLSNNESLAKQLNDSYNWLVEHEFQKTANVLAYPFGDFDDRVIEKAEKRYTFARGTKDGINAHPSLDYNDLYTLKVMSIYNRTSVQSVKNRIDSTIDQGLLTILVFHKIVDSNPSYYEYKKSDLQQISDYLKTKKKYIDVITLADYLIPNIESYTPVVNKTVRIFSNGSVNLLTNNKYDEYMPNMTIKPLNGFVDIRLNKGYENNAKISFSESASDTVQISLGELVPNREYLVKTYADGKMIQNLYLKSDRIGYINFDIEGYNSTRDIEIYTYYSNVLENNLNAIIIILISIIIFVIVYYRNIKG